MQRVWDRSCDGATLVTFVSCGIDQGEEPAVAPIRVQGAEQRNKRSRHTCDLCDKLIIGDLEWTGGGIDRVYGHKNLWLLGFSGEKSSKKASSVHNFHYFPQLTSSLRSIAIMWRKERGLTQPVTSPRLVLPPPSVQASQRTPLPPLPAVKPLRNLPKTTEQYTKESPWRFKSSVASGLRISPSPCRTLIWLHIWWRLFLALYLATGHQLCLSSAFSCFPVC